jgi:hypothetical protein
VQHNADIHTIRSFADRIESLVNIVLLAIHLQGICST